MAYVDRELVRAILRGTDNVALSSAASLSDDQMDAEISRAEVEIDTALSPVYATPFEPVPTAIELIARDISAFFADLTFRKGNAYDSQFDPVLMRYQAARRILDGLASGKYSLDALPSDRFGAEVINPYDGDLITIEHLFGPAQFG